MPPAAKAPFGLAFNSAGILYEADSGSGLIYAIDTNGVATVFLSGLGQPFVLAL